MHCDATAIELRDLTYRYPDGTKALDGINLTVAHGERVALLGPNGAGKSTLIGHLNGITHAQEGVVAIEKVAVTPETVSGVRQRVGVVFQDPDNMLFMTSIRDDVAFGPRNMGLPEDEVCERVDTALAAVGLAEVAGKPGLHLSFGQKKRAAMASVLSMRPAVLVLDEPTSNLDPRSKRTMTEFIASLQVTLVIATHDMDLAWTMCDRAVVLDRGKIVADGPARQLMVDRELMLQHGLEVPHLALHELAGRAKPHSHHRHEDGTEHAH